jgi:hypothetical protein
MKLNEEKQGPTRRVTPRNLKVKRDTRNRWILTMRKKKTQRIGAKIEDKQPREEVLLQPAKRIVNEFLKNELENMQEERKVKIIETQGLEKAMMMYIEITDTSSVLIQAKAQNMTKRQDL